MAGLGALGSHCQREAVGSALTQTYTRARGSLKLRSHGLGVSGRRGEAKGGTPTIPLSLAFFFFAKVILARDLAFFLSQC